MERNSELKLFGLHYYVQLQDRVARNDHEGSLNGLITYDTQTIRLGTHMVPEQRISTLIHEVIHAISTHLALDLEEKQVRTLEAGLTAFLLENEVGLDRLSQWIYTEEELADRE